MDQSKMPRHEPYTDGLKPSSEAMRLLVDQIISEFAAYEAANRVRSRARRAADDVSNKARITSILCNVIYAALRGFEGVRVDRGKSRLTKDKLRYQPVNLGKTAANLLNTLSEGGLGYLEQVKGDAKKRIMTSIKASSKLSELIAKYGVGGEDIKRLPVGETIWLKDGREDYWDRSQSVVYSDTAETRTFREEMQAINNALAGGEIACLADVYNDKGRIDPSKRYLVRIFTNRSFENGGRLYRGFWQGMRKEDRLAHLRVGGEVLVELDYGQAFLSILYGLAVKNSHKNGEHIELPPLESDLYEIRGIDKKYREQIKSVTNSMLFSERLKKMPKNSRRDMPTEIKVDFIQDSIEARHIPLKPFFYSSIGYKLMFYESQIMVRVMLSLINKGVCALPIHDAVLVPKSAVELAETVMRDEFRAVAGVEARLKKVSLVDGELRQEVLL